MIFYLCTLWHHWQVQYEICCETYKKHHPRYDLQSVERRSATVTLHLRAISRFRQSLRDLKGDGSFRFIGMMFHLNLINNIKEIKVLKSKHRGHVQVEFL